MDCLSGVTCTKKCGDYVWYTNNDFCTWLFSDNNKHFIALAHNMKSYDGYFILNYIVSNFLPGDRLPEVLLNGSNNFTY